MIYRKPALMHMPKFNTATVKHKSYVQMPDFNKLNTGKPRISCDSQIHQKVRSRYYFIGPLPFSVIVDKVKP